MKNRELIYREDLYFQGVLQIRPSNIEVLNFAINQIKKSKSCELTKIVEKKEGFDLYLTSQKFVQNLGNRLRKSFKGTIKKSKTIYGRNKLTSKDVYRVTVCFRLNK